MALSVDPALGVALRAGLALLLATASAHKLRDFAAFRAALGAYRLLPGRAAGAAAGALVAAEIATAGALVFGERGGVAAASLFALYSAAIAVNLWRGRREIDCGCFGPARRQPLSWALVARNAALIAFALACALPVEPRALVALDAFTIAALLAFAALAWASTNALIANAPRLRALREA